MLIGTANDVPGSQITGGPRPGADDDRPHCQPAS